MRPPRRTRKRPPASLAPSPKLPFAERVGEAAALVARPTFFGAGILTLVYVPVLSLTGVDGKMFRPMAITVVLALTIALVFALSFVPAAAASWLRERDVPSRDPWLVRALTALYVPVLVRVRRHPLAVGVASLTILGGGLYGMAHLGSELAPTLDEGSLVIQTTRAPDISLESSALDAQRLERALLERFPREVVQVVSRVGSPAVATDVMGFEQADVFVELAPRERWRPGLDKTALVAEMEAHLAEADPTANPGFTQPIQMRFNELLGGAPTDVVVGVFGHDLDELRDVAEEVHAAIVPVRGVQDARILAPDALPVLEVVPRPVDVERTGLSVRDVLDTVQAMRFGLVVGMSYLGPHPMPVVLGLGGEGRTAFDLRSLPVPLSSGVTVPLSALADVRSIEGPGAIGHDGGERRLFVGFNVRGRDLGDTVGDARAAIGKAMSLPTGMRLEWGGQVETLRAALERLAVVVPAVLALILALLAVAFRSLRVALVVFGLVPFASVGGVAALALRGMTLSVTAHIGFIALSGIAVMNGVVLVNEIRRRQALGADVHEASFEAARSRMRPVVMTALVAALGFLPMMVATGVGAEVQRPLATVVFGGLLSSTLLTLFVLPTVYPYLVGWRRPEGRRGGGSPSAEPEPAAS